MNSLQYLLTVVVLFTCVQTGFTLQCIVCNSTLDHNCQDKFDHKNPRLFSDYQKTCEMYNAQFCIKVTGLWGGVVGTHRFCSARDLGDQCQDMYFPHHDRFYRGCVNTCTGDICNSATSLFSVSSALVVLLATSLVSLITWL